MTVGAAARTVTVARRALVAQLASRRMRQVDIAAALAEAGYGAVSQQLVSDDLRAVRREWQRQYLGELDAIKAQELADLDAIEEDAARQFALDHDPAWLAIRLKAKDRRAKLLGLDAPLRVDIGEFAVAVARSLGLPDETAREVARVTATKYRAAG